MSTPLTSRVGEYAGYSPRRLWALTRSNALLTVRNRLTLSYAVALPLLPMLFLAFADGDVAAGSQAAQSALLTAFLFPVFYNVLSLLVTRRDELVLKRLRTGQTRDLELVASLALPGSVVALLISVVAVGVGMAFGLPAPENPVVYLIAIVAACLMFVGFAVWTAAWTRNAEAAQLTSIPVIALAVLGTLQDVLPERVADVVAYTPMAAIQRLIDSSWFGVADNGDPIGFAATWGEAAVPLLVLAAWMALAVDVARRQMRWEPRG